MARRSAKAPPTVEPNQLGCVWDLSGMFDHHRHRLGRHRTQSITGAGHERNQARMLTFDEQLRSINIKSKKKTTSASQSNTTIENNEAQKNNMEKSFWKKIKSRYESPNKKKENTSTLDTIVVLKPNQRVVESVVDVGCRCSYLHSRHSSTSKQQIVKHTNISFNDVRKKLKSSKKLKSIQKMKPCSEIDVNGSRNGKLSLVPFSKKKEPEVFVEARRHLAERLRLVAQGAGLVEHLSSSSKPKSRTLERVLLSSPKHESMASFGCEPEGTRGSKSLQKTWSGLSPWNQDSDSQNIGPSLDVSSPKTDCKSENMDNDHFRENPSPVSVLDSFFSDNICSPTSTIESVELQFQPQRLDFEEHASQTSSPPRKNSLSSLAEDRTFISSYVNDIYQFSQSNWEEFLAKDYPFESSCDHDKLLHDCVKEVLVSLHSRMTIISSKIRPFSLEKDVVNEVIEQIDWHNGQPEGPRTLDHLVRRDIAKCGEWIDTLSDKNDIVFEVVDETLQNLIMETIQDIFI
ncbi:hypothetical protein QVD17_02014 [Tagetes erecta]|uniref:DUF4378 domain-containing protein n=1 Tax=Tagetes erecta TaxID=13708 RepID=A0AAD8L5U2_TARER|nr:hypothetical protein QVD17_02014 [Tagetes erecta]